MRQLTEDAVMRMPIQDRCARILDEFDAWLATRVLHFKLRHEDLPRLNDAFRDYFTDTRTSRISRTPGGSS
jgi:hypothetical protein